MRIIISGGGTGGHVYPAIAIANALKEKGVKEILFVGALGKIEMEKVPKAGFDIQGLDIQGFHRTRKWRNIWFPFRLIKSMLKAKKIIEKFGPNIAIGVGGYASGPLLKMAQMKNIPTIIQEQNSYPGITNKLLAKGAHKIFVAYNGMDKYFDASKLVKSGNPVRKDLLNIVILKADGIKHFNLEASKKTILIFGGSLGARSINKAVAAQEEMIAQFDDIQVVWQVGKIYYDQYRDSRLAQMKHVQVLPFIDRMDYAYSVADVIVSRAGALTISELTLVGKPSLLVPSPNVAEDHQTKNAMALVNEDAALLVKDGEANDKMIIRAIELLHDTAAQQRLSTNLLKLAKPNAREEIADEILKLGSYEAQ